MGAMANKGSLSRFSSDGLAVPNKMGRTMELWLNSASTLKINARRWPSRWSTWLCQARSLKMWLFAEIQCTWSELLFSLVGPKLRPPFLR